jgi:hypothetical protein
MNRGAASMMSSLEQPKSSDQMLLSVVQNWRAADRRARARAVYMTWRFLSKRKRFKRQDYVGRGFSFRR